MSLRAVLLGLAGGILISAWGYINDSVIGLNFLVGNHFPITVFGGLFVVVALVNPLLRRLGASLPLRRSELAVVMALTLVACAIPGSGLMRKFTHVVALPPYYELSNEGWKSTGVLGYAPKGMLLNDGKYDDESVGGYLRGREKARGRLDFGKVPWSSWQDPIRMWVPLLLLVAVAVVCMGLIVHTHWSKREMLPYPIARFAGFLTGQGEGESPVPLLRNTLFWAGFAAIFALRVNNGLASWFQDYFISVPLFVNFSALQALWPDIGAAYGAWGLFFVQFFPTAVAFAYFLSSEVGLSLGLSQVVAVPVIAIFMGFGVNVASGYTGDGLVSWQMFGSYLAIGLVVLFTGRHYYGRVLRSGLGLSGRFDDVPGHAVWAFRGLALACVGMVALLVAFGLPLPIAAVFVALMLLVFLITARINAECGLFHIEANWNVLGVLMGLFGAAALGPGVLVITGLLCAVLMLDYRETLMPFLVNGLKMCDDARVRLGRVGWAAIAMFAIGLAVAIPVVLAANYAGGAPLGDRWGTSTAPRFPFSNAQIAINRMQAAGTLDESLSIPPMERLARISPEPRFLWAAGIGVALVLVFSVLRMRVPWWPLHPVMFLTWCTYPLMMFSHSFLIGWIIKKCVTTFGGQKLHARLGPLMVGVIAGEVIGGGLFMAIGVLYYAITGMKPPSYYIFPA